MKEEVKRRIISAVVDQKIPLKDVAKKLYISERQLKLLFKGWGVELPRRRKYTRVPMPDRANLMKLYSQLGTTAKVGEYFGVGVNTIAKWMRELRIPTKKLVGMTEEERTSLLEEHLEKLERINL